MALHNISPVREQIRTEILAALANGAAMSTAELYDHCPSVTEYSEIANIVYDMWRAGRLETGDKVIHAPGMLVNTYRLPTTEDPRIEAAKPLVVERKIPRTTKPPKPAQDHPFRTRIVAQEAHDGATRVTWPLPIHLKTTAPQAAAVTLDEAEMSEEPMPYITNPDAFTLEPREPEADRDIDAELTDLLSEVAALQPATDAVMLAGEYVGDQAAPRKACQCLRINSLPRLPQGYIYGGIKVWIESEHDVGIMTIATHDEGGGAFASIKATGRLSFDAGDLVTIGQVADALIKLHDSMGECHE